MPEDRRAVEAARAAVLTSWVSPSGEDRMNCTTTTLDIFGVDYACHEVFSGVIAPGETWYQETWDAHPFRLRDHATHGLV